MFGVGKFISRVKSVILASALLAYPCAALAQHGGGAPGGGGSVSSAGGGGLSGSAGRATGVSTKDELKDFRAVLAVQATSQQIVAFNSMVKSAAAAGVELQGFLDLLAKANANSDLAGRSATVDQALERARTENKKFLDGLSERQKSGLKELTKKLAKSDSDLDQQARALDQMIADPKAVPQQIASSAAGLDHALASFRSQQTDLGSEMSIGVPDNGAGSSFTIPPIKNSFNFASQAVAIATSGVISTSAPEGGQNLFKLELTADLSDLQDNMAGVLRAQLNKEDRCGEQIAIQTAALTPLPPASLVVVQLHYERWACFGRDTQNEMAEGNGTVELRLMPAVGQDGTLTLLPETRRIDAQGLVGELLRSGSLGETLRDTITQSLLFALRRGGDFKATLPVTAQGYATLRHAQFQGTGSGQLMAVLDGEIRVSNEVATALIAELRGRASSPENIPEKMQVTAPR
jgi:hypothetical protein